MVCDGDSKAYNEVWETYGVCDDCEKFEKMDKKSQQYKKWLDTEAYNNWEKSHLNGTAECKRVNKLDCIGHVQKRMGKNLINMTKGQKLSDGKPIGGRSGRLTRPAIDLLQNYYGKAIRDNVNRKAKTRQEIDKSIIGMQVAIKASLYHSVKLPDKERHQYCPKHKKSWCPYQKSIALGEAPTYENKTYHLDPVFIEYLTPLYDRLSTPKLLKRCVPGYSQNANESVNGIVWTKCPKHLHKGAKRVETAAGSATLQFNGGATNRQHVMDNMQAPAGYWTKKGSAKKNATRLSNSLVRANIVFQKSMKKN